MSLTWQKYKKFNTNIKQFDFFDIFYLNGLIMNGIELRKLLKINDLTNRKAAEIFGVTEETVSRWCSTDEELPKKAQRNIKSNLRIKSLDYSEIHGGNFVNSGVVNESTIDQRQYFSDSPDVLRSQIETLDERIREKDAQIREKDAQIRELLKIISQLSEK